MINQLSELQLKDKALLFTKNGTIRNVKPKGKWFTLKELQKLVDGLIEVHPVRINGNYVVVNEEGTLKDFSMNYIFRELTGLTVFGPVLVCPVAIFEPDDQ